MSLHYHYHQLLEKEKSQDSFLSVQELQKLHSQNHEKPYPYQLQAVYRYAKKYYLGLWANEVLKSNLEVGSNLDNSHTFFQALTQLGYKKAYSMLSHQSFWSFKDDIKIRHQKTIAYCEQGGVESGKKAHFSAFVAAIHLNKDLTEAFHYLGEAARLGNLAAWIVLQAICFEFDAATIYPQFGAIQHSIEVSEINVPEARHLAAKILESLIVNDQVSQMDNKSKRLNQIKLFEQVGGFDPTKLKDTVSILKFLSDAYGNGSERHKIAVDKEKASLLLAKISENQGVSARSSLFIK
jgi:hypothetical protein